eukprot:CAMPEP_0184709458 /NCGR_PEP_ID=MMETSP0314-20130426/596_1 /TAXON_ID=38298 /ORGANISM="Rhodella maculata, Strain CCMP 736" /LENGTH=137 /DNA_ID=CAMNT_0027171165 /DNA_START=201 /DNA_END=614 /DNA_ORIENTATION=-
MSACPSVESLEAAFGPAEPDEFLGDAVADDFKAASPNDAVEVISRRRRARIARRSTHPRGARIPGRVARTRTSPEDGGSFGGRPSSWVLVLFVRGKEFTFVEKHTGTGRGTRAGNVHGHGGGGTGEEREITSEEEVA